MIFFLCAMRHLSISVYSTRVKSSILFSWCWMKLKWGYMQTPRTRCRRPNLFFLKSLFTRLTTCSLVGAYWMSIVSREKRGLRKYERIRCDGIWNVFFRISSKKTEPETKKLVSSTPCDARKKSRLASILVKKYSTWVCYIGCICHFIFTHLQRVYFSPSRALESFQMRKAINTVRLNVSLSYYLCKCTYPSKKAKLPYHVFFMNQTLFALFVQVLMSLM